MYLQICMLEMINNFIKVCNLFLILKFNEIFLQKLLEKNFFFKIALFE